MGKKLNTPFKLIHFVNHSHIDRTWWDSPEACRERNEEIINTVLDACRAGADFKFSYELTSGLMAYLDKFPDRADEIKGILKSGRLDVGGLFISPHADALSDEAIARNICLGKGWLKRTLDYTPSVAKEFDVPGHTLQMPQLLKSAGMDTLVITRGPRGGFYWVGPDGSEILTFCVPYNWSYWRKLGVDLGQTEENLPAELERAAADYSGADLIIPDGDDMTLPNLSLPEIAERWNEIYDKPKLVVSTMEEAVKAVRVKKASRRSGDMPNLWVVVHALQAETTRAMKRIHNLLPVVESLCTMRCIGRGSYKTYPAQQIDSCWRDSLLVADHNWGGRNKEAHGAEGDEHKEKLAKEALRKCQKLVEEAVEGLSYSLPQEESPEGLAVIVHNPTGWERTDAVSVEVSCSIPGLEAVEIVDEKGGAVPFDTEVLEKHDDGTIERAFVDFLGRDLPPLGYTTYCARPIMEPVQTEAKTRPEGASIENEFYRVEFSEDGSFIKSLYDKQFDMELAGRFAASAGPLEFEFGMFELFGTGLRLKVPGRSFFENPDNEGTGESVEPTGEIWRASDYPASVRIEKDGEFLKSMVAEGEFVQSKRRQRVVLYKGIKRVDLHLELDWEGQPDAVIYLEMPSALMNGQKYLSVPFGVHRDGDEIRDFWVGEDMPVKFKTRGLQDWLCFEEEGRGLAVATRWPMVDFTLAPAFPLLWTNASSGFFFGERYKQIGKHNYSFSLTSYEGSWQENNIHQWGRQWSKPTMTFFGDEAPTERRRSYVSADKNNIVVSTLKKAEDEDAVVVRLYETTGKKTTARLQTSFPIKRAQVMDIIETTASKLASQEDSIKLSFRPFEIKTLKLYI